MADRLVIVKSHARRLGFRTGDYRFFRWLGLSPLRSLRYRRGYRLNRPEIIEQVRTRTIAAEAWRS